MNLIAMTYAYLQSVGKERGREWVREVRKEGGMEMGKEVGTEVEKQEGGGGGRRREEDLGEAGRSWEELGGAENITINFIMQNVQLLLFRIQ